MNFETKAVGLKLTLLSQQLLKKIIYVRQSYTLSSYRANILKLPVALKYQQSNLVMH